LQDPDDWRVSMREAVLASMHTAGVTSDDVIGIGIDFTSCTVLPTNGAGVPLCEIDQWRSHPHAWPKLWKHHAAQPQANRITALAREREEKWLARYGGVISSEWALPKSLEILERDPACYAAADRIIEGGDWMVWQLTGTLVRNACGAGYKGTWHKRDGWVDTAFLRALDNRFERVCEEKFAGPIIAPGTCVGGLKPEWAAALGLRAGTPVGAAIIDAHAGCLGAGVSTAGTMFIAAGTSSCHMLMNEHELHVPGISGVVEDGIVAGLYGYEAGQASSGDILSWFVDQKLGFDYYQEAGEHGVTAYDVRACVPGRAAFLPSTGGTDAARRW
jgi:L-ribulokinase